MNTSKFKKTPGARNQATLDLLDSMNEIATWARDGLTLDDIKQRYPHRVRIRVFAPEAGAYPPAKVRALREKIRASQGDFASLIGVSRILVQSWERGVREPSPLARRLLDIISKDPAAWLAGLQDAPKNKSRRAG